MKILAMYLPQYHAIPENDKWWGEGYTEWTAVKNAKPLYRGHKEPRVPLNQNYYDLAEENASTWAWQASLARKYGVHGFCIYHYWFEGKLLLEKPIELLLNHKEIDVNYCLCWANESWTNAWKEGKNCQTIIAQTYGGKKDWEAHFNYLLPFFKDNRYICINGKPLLVIYRADLVEDMNEMIEYIQEKAKENGFEGITFAYQHPSFDFDGKKNDSHLDYNILFEPIYSYCYSGIARSFKTLKLIKKKISNCMERLIGKNLNNINPYRLQKFDYDEVWNSILDREVDDEKYIPGGFVDWDNTPRRKEKGKVYFGASPDKFKCYLSKLIKKTKEEYKKDIIFITAWNEWGEGSYLEPDEQFKYGYLEAIYEALKENDELEVR